MLKSAHGIPRHFYFHILGDAKLYPILLKSCNSTVNTAVGNDLIANFEVLDHVLYFLLIPTGGHDHDEVVNGENDQERQDKTVDAGLLGRLQKQRFELSLFVFIPHLGQELIEAAKLDKLPYSIHSVKVEVEVMDCIQDGRQNLSRHK
jgi:hypothetical protein